MSAFNSGALDAELFTQLAALPDQESFAQAVVSLLPEVNSAAEQGVFQNFAMTNNFINRRLGVTSRVAGMVEGTRYASLGAMSSDASSSGSSAERSAWVQGGIRQAEMERGSNISDSGYESDVTNLSFGYDFDLSNDLAAGIAAGYSSLDIDHIGENVSEDDISISHVTAYIGGNSGRVFFSGQLGVASGEGDAKRLSGLDNSAITGSYDVSGYNAQATLGYDVQSLESDNLKISFLTGLQMGSFTRDAYTETGGLDLAIGEQSSDYVEGKAGFIVSKVYGSDYDYIGTSFSLAYVADFSDEDTGYSVAFGNDELVGLQSAGGIGDRFEYGVGLTVQPMANMSLTFDVEGEVSPSGTYDSLGGSLRARWAF